MWKSMFAVAAVLVATGASAMAQSLEDLQKQMEAMRRDHDAKIAELRNDYETRIRSLEEEADSLRSSTPAAMALESAIQEVTDHQHEHVHCAHAQFDNSLNPALSVTGDFVFAASSKDDSYDELDRFILRDVEVAIQGRVDSFVYYYMAFHFDEDDIELEEAYGVADDWLPDTFELKFGRYNVDFGVLSPIHDHDLPFVDKPSVLQEYLGGALRGTGLELHHDFALCDSADFRWSVGIVNELDGDAHPVLGPLAGAAHAHDEEDDLSFGERGIENFAFTVRGAARITFDESTFLQVGASAAWEPERRAFLHDEEAAAMAVSVPGHVSVHTEKLTVGVDVLFKRRDAATGEGFRLGLEALFNNQSFVLEHDEEHEEGVGAEPLTSGTMSAFGLHAWGEYWFDHHWSAGVSGNWFERATNDREEWWDLGAFVTWHVTETNRLRLEVRYIDDDLLGEDHVTVMLQWTTFLGAHGHAHDF